MCLECFFREGIEPTRSDVFLNLTIPGIGIEFTEPPTQLSRLLSREGPNRFLNLPDLGHRCLKVIGAAKYTTRPISVG